MKNVTSPFLAGLFGVMLVSAFTFDLPLHSDDSLSDKSKPTVYMKQFKKFYFRVSLDGESIDTICLKTYSSVISEINQGKISWIYDTDSNKPKEYFTGVVEDDTAVW